MACLLLIACANVANLVLAKTISRRKEVGDPRSIRRQTPPIAAAIPRKHCCSALTGGALGLIFRTTGGVDGEYPEPSGYLDPARLPSTAGYSAFTFGISLLSGIAAGVLPALRLAGQDGNEALKEGLGRTSSDSGGNRTRNVLVVSEVALSLMLLIGAGLLIRSLWILRSANPGFDSDHVITMTVSISLGQVSRGGRTNSILRSHSGSGPRFARSAIGWVDR